MSSHEPTAATDSERSRAGVIESSATDHLEFESVAIPKEEATGHFRITFSLLLKESLGAHPFT